MREKTADSESQREVASNGSVSSSAVAGGSRRFSLYLQSVAQISGVATIIAATVYALGVFTLVLPVSTSYSSTFPAAWYAVSVVPKTVVVGHGMKSLLWPSLALTVATTMFALTVLWVLYSVSAGWRHARATAETPALSPLSMVKIYAFLSVVTVAILLAVSGALLGWEATWSGGYAEAGIGVYVVDVVLGWAFFSAAGLCVLSYLTAAVFLIARWLRGTSRLIRSRSVPSVSFRGFIYKGLAFAVVSSVFFSMAGILSGGVFDLLHPEYADMATYPEGSLPTLFFWPLSLTLVLVALFGLAAALYLMLVTLRAQSALDQ